MTYLSGASSFLKAAYEDSDVWGEAAASMTEPNSTYFAFGQGVDSSVTRTNTKERIYGVGARNTTATIAKQFAGTISVNGSVSNWYWLLGVLGANANGGSAPSSYTHTYTEADSLPTLCVKRRASFTTATNEVFQGCVINSATVTAAVNEAVKFNLEMPFRYTKLDTDAETATPDAQKVYTFAGGTIEIPDGTTIAAIQNFELTIQNTAEMIYGVGSRFPEGFVAKNREYNIRFTAAIQDFSLLSRLFDGSTGTAPSATSSGAIASLILTFINSDGNSCVLTFGETHFNEDTLPQSVNDVIKEDISGWSHSLTSAVYTNAVQTAPAAATNVA